MTVQVGGGNPGVIGRMFARQYVPDIYGKQKGAVEATRDKSGDPVDFVDLSPAAPKPLSASLVEEAMGMGEKLAGRGKLTQGEKETLREDRVFAAVVALMASGSDPEAKSLAWPVGIPSPTREEMEAAYRRLSQRMVNVEDASDPEAANKGRTEALEKNRNSNFEGLLRS